MNLKDKLQQAFSNDTCIKKFKESLGLDDIQVKSESDGVKIVFVKEDKLETLLVKPQRVQVGPKQRRTQTGIQHVAGYIRSTSKTDTEDLIKAQESDTDIEKKTSMAFQEFIECCLESIDGQSITIE
jgi:hypothetical protein